MIRKFGGSSGIDTQPAGIDLGVGGSNVKSIQRGTVSFASTDLTKNITINSIDITKSIVLITSVAYGAYSFMELFKSSIVDATTINISRAVASNQEYSKIVWQVIEFNNVKTLQKGDASFTSGQTKTVTISTIDTAKSMLVFSFSANNNGYSYPHKMIIAGEISSATQLIFTASEAINNSYNIHWQVIEFN